VAENVPMMLPMIAMSELARAEAQIAVGDVKKKVVVAGELVDEVEAAVEAVDAVVPVVAELEEELTQPDCSKRERISFK
jgi:hypothetical protein